MERLAISDRIGRGGFALVAMLVVGTLFGYLWGHHRRREPAAIAPEIMEQIQARDCTCRHVHAVAPPPLVYIGYHVDYSVYQPTVDRVLVTW